MQSHVQQLNIQILELSQKRNYNSILMSTEQNIEKSFIITEKLKKNKTRKGYNKIESLYEGVIHKNFQTIDELLKKLSFILTRHEQFEVQLASHIKKFAKFESDLQTIHNEHRRDNLIINTNINGIRTDIMGIDTHIKLLFDGTKYKGISNLSVQNTKPIQPYNQQNQRNMSVFSSANKLSDCSQFNRIPQDKDLHIYSKKSFDMNSSIQKNSSRIKPTNSLGGSLSHFDSRPEAFQENVIIKKQKHIAQTVNVEKESSIRLIDEDRGVISEAKNSHVSKQSIRINQNKNQDPIPSQNKKILQMDQSFNTLKNCGQNMQESKKQEKLNIVAQFSKHTNTISSIFKAARQQDLGYQQMKEKLTNIVKSILVEDSVLGQKISQGMDAQKASRQISQFLYLCMFGDGSQKQQKGKQQKERLIALQKQKQRIDMQIGKIKQIQQKLQQNHHQLELIKQQFYKISKKDEMMKQFNRINQKITDICKQISEVRDSTKGFITCQQMYNEHFKMVEKNKKTWEDCYSSFANKTETKKAIQYLDGKIKQVVVNLKVTQNIEVEEIAEEKCLCCAKTVIRSPAPRLTIRTARNSHSSSNNGEATKRVKPHELKKKTLEVLKHEKKRDEGSKSVNFSAA